MRVIIAFLLIVFAATACTKSVPETQKKSVKSLNEKEIRNVFKILEDDYNSGEIIKIDTLFTPDFTAFKSGSDFAINPRKYTDELSSFLKQKPDSKLVIKIEDLFLSDDFAAVQTFSSITMYDPIEKKMNPVYSERSIELLKKIKNNSWKIIRSISIPAYSYD